MRLSAGPVGPTSSTNTVRRHLDWTRSAAALLHGRPVRSPPIRTRATTTNEHQFRGPGTTADHGAQWRDSRPARMVARLPITAPPPVVFQCETRRDDNGRGHWTPRLTELSACRAMYKSSLEDIIEHHRLDAHHNVSADIASVCRCYGFGEDVSDGGRWSIR